MVGTSGDSNIITRSEWPKPFAFFYGTSGSLVTTCSVPSFTDVFWTTCVKRLLTREDSMIHTYSKTKSQTNNMDLENSRNS